jgi:hypothetical protein
VFSTPFLNNVLRQDSTWRYRSDRDHTFPFLDAFEEEFKCAKS